MSGMLSTSREALIIRSDPTLAAYIAELHDTGHDATGSAGVGLHHQDRRVRALGILQPPSGARLQSESETVPGVAPWPREPRIHGRGRTRARPLSHAPPHERLEEPRAETTATKTRWTLSTKRVRIGGR